MIKKMISIVCVYNDQQTLSNVLLKSLGNQTVEFELITLDNTDNRYRSAAEALNYGGEKAKGDYIMFAHNDVWLASNSWLEDVEEILQSIPDLGAAGVAGMSEKGRKWEERVKFSIDVFDEGHLAEMGRVEKLEEVQTLDESLLIVPRPVFAKLHFDEKVFDGWDCYAADYCLSVTQLGLNPYVIPAFVYDRSLRRNVENLLEYQKRLYNKHRKNYRKIYTTCGEISWLRLRWRSLIEILSPLYDTLFPGWTEHLKKELADCDRVLDLGCGYNSSLLHCNIPFTVGVELFEPYLQESKRKSIHSQYIRADITKLEFRPRSFDAVVAIELLEHLTKQEGAELVGKMEKWTTSKVIITTPNGYLWQDGYDDNPLQEHKSGWSVGELRKLGFEVRGINGWKKLRGYKASIKHKPSFLWTRISDLTQKITYHYPRLAFQLLAVKQTKGEK